MPVHRISRDQHPHAVARAVVQLAAREAYHDTAALRGAALEALAPLARNVGDAELTGRWVPGALHRWARAVTFVREPGPLGEVLLSARHTIRSNMGDCDDVALAVCAMAMVFGVRATAVVRWIGPRMAHVAAVVAPDWNGSAPALVIDPQLEAIVELERGSPWQFGRVMPEAL